MVFFWIISCAFSLLVGLLIGGLLVVSHYDDTAPTPAEGATPINKFRAYTISFNNGRSYSVTASNVYWDKDDEWVDFVDQFAELWPRIEPLT
jgi:hypothetical protein